MEPVITVLIRTHNSQDTIETALRSVLHQTFNSNGYSTLVVDDGSIDESTELVLRCPEASLIETDGVGPVAALNIGLEGVETPFVILLDSDDWFEPTILEAMYGVLESSSEIGFVYSDYYEVVNQSRRVISVKDNIFNTVAAGIMFTVELLQSFGFYDESLNFPEYDLLIKLLPGTIGHYIPEPLYNYIRHPGSLTASNAFVRKGIDQLFEKYGRHYPIRDYQVLHDD